MRSEYRSPIDPSLKRRIEKLVRTSKVVDDAEEITTPCCYCSEPLGQTELECASCKNSLPYCIVTVCVCVWVCNVMCDV
jgi:WD repeat-containing protein 19